MDSASSGSMQSSSGGGGSGGGGGGGDNDEYQSHCGELMSSFLKNHDLSSPKPEQQQQQQQPPPPNFFDLSNILDASFQQNSNLHHYLNSGSLSSSLPSSTTQPLNLDSKSHPCNNLNINKASSSKRVDEKQNIIAIKNNSKKRSRASRRAPTTVLTTDTINFRQIVQEFTGIPAFDIFSRRANHQMNALGSSYPLRPVQQKGSSSTTSPSLLNSRLINARTEFEVVPTENSLPPNLKQPHQNQTENVFNNMQNQFTFQSVQHSTISPGFNGGNHGSSSMAAPSADLDELG